MSEWKEYNMSELIDEIAMGPFGSNIKVDCFVKKGVPVLNGSNLTGFKLSEKSFNYVTKEKAESLGRSNAKRGDIIVTHRGTLGQVSYIPDDSSYDSYVISQSQFRFSCKKDLVFVPYLVYYFHSREGQYKLLSNACQVGVPALARPTSTFKEISVILPPIEEQKRIAGVLSSLDDKIDLLNRENATLEALAETLFRHYFIENPDPTWKEGKVSDIAIHCKDSINPKKQSDEIFFHYSIPAYDNGKRPAEEQGRNIQSNKYVVSQNCILFSKLNPHKDKRVWLMLDDVQPNAICSTEFQIVKPQNDQWLYFLYEWLTYKENYDEIASGVSGTSGSHQRIDPKVIFDNECLIVDDGILAQYNEQVLPIFKKVKSNQQQMQTMVAKRDTLLPRIMSGEVKVTEH
ncbi:MAG: restriction endonuclease subunit S [Bacteroidales bacterium]|nr:restriction endonuclease subunit S [Bacteroidales bacterium]